jgi:DNA (cytosine-5)-methyltransferase 1
MAGEGLPMPTDALPAISCDALLAHSWRHLDLFSGIGGFALACRMVGEIETVAFCEIDPWARRVLTKNFPNIPVHEDVKTLNPNDYGKIDLITGGFPCQPYSTAGKRNGDADARALWPEMLRIIGEAKPRWVLGENVVGFKGVALDAMLDALENLGYSCQAFDIPASSLGAWHRRSRLWIVAHLDGGRWNAQPLLRARAQERDCADDADRASTAQRGENPWMAEPAVERVVYGLSRKMDKLRIKGLGNAIVPQVAAEILRCMMRVDSLHNACLSHGEGGERP